MKTLAFALLAMCVLMGTAVAQFHQPPPAAVAQSKSAVRDGFALSSDGTVMVTRDGVTQRVTGEFVLTNGTHLFPNGDIIFYTGDREHLRPNELLTLDGSIDHIKITAQGIAPLIPPGAKDNDVVGISSRDGITVSGADTLITRNGVTDKITNQIQLSHGLLVKPDGTFIKDGQKWTLRANQILGFDGVVREARIHETGPAAPPVLASPEK